MFHHVVQKQLNDSKIHCHKPSTYLDLYCSHKQFRDIGPTTRDLYEAGNKKNQQPWMYKVLWGHAEQSQKIAPNEE
jgi:hypothetical protein